MNRCPNCAAQNRDGAKFCTSCGFRLPGDEVVAATLDRSPFATTQSVPWHSEPTAHANDDVADDAGFATWTTDTTDDSPGPGSSWDAAPPIDRAVPVSDDMIASLLDVEEATVADEPTQSVAEESDVIELESGDQIEDDESDLTEFEPFEPEPVDDETTPVESPAVVASSRNEIPPSIDSLLKLARDLEYGLIELADAPDSSPMTATGVADVGVLSGVLSDLQSDEDMTALRNAITTAQERPRDVDVMLDLVLRADAIAAVISERDSLKSAIELALRGSDTDIQEDESASDDESDSA